MRYIVANNKNIDRLGDNELLIELLRMRGVESPSQILNLSPHVLHDTYLFKNIDRALEMFHYYMTRDSKIHIIMD